MIVAGEGRRSPESRKGLKADHLAVGGRDGKEGLKERRGWQIPATDRCHRGRTPAVHYVCAEGQHPHYWCSGGFGWTGSPLPVSEVCGPPLAVRARVPRTEEGKGPTVRKEATLTTSSTGEPN